MRWIVFALSAGALLAASSADSNGEDDPRLEKILDHWKTLPDDLQSCRLSGRRFVYDAVFQVEKRAKFDIGWEEDGRAILCFMPVKISKGTESQRLNPKGKPYSVKTDLEETWYWPDRQEVIQVKDNGIERFAQRYEIAPPQQSNQGGLWWPRDGFSSLKQLLIEFPVHPALTKLPGKLNWTISKEDESYYWMSGAVPENSHLSRNFKRLELILNKSDLSICAMRFLDPAGTTETVYCFSELEVNPHLHIDLEILGINEERLRFIEPYKQQLTEPLKAPKPTQSSGLTLLFVDLTTRLFSPWLQ